MAREHRLYQMDWLSRVYGFAEEEMRPAFDSGGFLDLAVDPKLTIAVHQLERFPMDVNQASHEELVRVPGIGPISAQRIVRQRKQHSITRWQELQAMGVTVKRALPFIRYPGHRPVQATQGRLPLFHELSTDLPSTGAMLPKAQAAAPAQSFEQVHQAHVGAGCHTCPLHQRPRPSRNPRCRQWSKTPRWGR